MGQDNTWGVQNTANGLWMTSQSPYDPLWDGFGNEADAINTLSETNANNEASALNSAYGVDSFIGGHPRPH